MCTWQHMFQTLVEGGLEFLQKNLGIGRVMMNLIAGLCFLTAAGCLLFELYTLEELKMVLFGGVVFVIHVSQRSFCGLLAKKKVVHYYQ
jgi:hypothetical protein